MSLGTIIYKILIGPLELFFETVFMIANRLVETRLMRSSSSALP